MLQHFLYNISLLVDALSAASSKSALVKVMQNYLSAGAHPFFLQQGLWHMRWHLSETAVEAAQRLLKLSARKFQEVAKPGHGLSGPLERVYVGKGKPRQVHEGVLQGSFLECYASLSQWHSLGQLPLGWQSDWDQVVHRFFEHPGANIALLDNILHLDRVFADAVHGKFASMSEAHHELGQDFISRRAAKIGIHKVTAEILNVWTSKTQFRCFSLLHLWLRSQPTQPMRATAILEAVLAACKEGKGRLKQVARELVHYPLTTQSKGDAEDGIQAFFTVQALVEQLKSEMPNLRTFHCLIRWLQVSPAYNRDSLVLLLAFRFDQTLAMDTRVEDVVKAVVGFDAWKALTVLADPKYWRISGQVIPGFTVHSGIDMATPEYQLFQRKLEEAGVRFNHHNALLAEAVDGFVYSTGITQPEANSAWEYAVNLLAGDNVLASSHLRPEGTQVRRTTEQFLGAEIPRIDIARHPDLGENGAACRFKIFFADLPESQIAGFMNQEGQAEFDNIAVLTSLGGSSLQAVVAETLASLIIPRYIEQLPRRHQRGGGMVFTGEVWASHPTIHTLGEIREREPEEESLGTRINPTIAEWLFLWLLDKDLSRDWRLYRQTHDMVDGEKEPYFLAWDQAKSLLQNRQVALGSVYTHTVRAHTKPVAVRLVDNDIVVDQVSERAKRNYQRFLRDTGRELDMQSFVRKTYQLPGGKRLILDLPRTFNQGAYNDLVQVWDMVPNPELKREAQKRFKF